MPVVITTSAIAPSLILAETLTPDWKVMATLCPLARSNAGTNSSSTSRMAVELSRETSAAFAAVAATAAPRQPAKAAAIFGRVFIFASRRMRGLVPRMVKSNRAPRPERQLVLPAARTKAARSALKRVVSSQNGAWPMPS